MGNRVFTTAASEYPIDQPLSLKVTDTLKHDTTKCGLRNCRCMVRTTWLTLAITHRKENPRRRGAIRLRILFFGGDRLCASLSYQQPALRDMPTAKPK